MPFMKTLMLLLLGMLVINPAVIPAEESVRKHPIDVKIEAAAEKAMSTVDMIQVQDNGLKLWDAEMNRVYGLLKKRLKPDAFALLQAAQRDWIKYRDDQVKFIGEFYTQFDGTMYRPMQVAAVMEVTRQRGLELTRILEMLEEHGG